MQAKAEFAQVKGAAMPHANLRHANGFRTYIAKADLSGAKLQEADLRGANLQDAKLMEANLRGANLRGADLVGTWLENADLSGAELFQARLTVTQLQSACGDPATKLPPGTKLKPCSEK